MWVLGSPGRSQREDGARIISPNCNFTTKKSKFVCPNLFLVERGGNLLETSPPPRGRAAAQPKVFTPIFQFWIFNLVLVSAICLEKIKNSNLLTTKFEEQKLAKSKKWKRESEKFRMQIRATRFNFSEIKFSRTQFEIWNVSTILFFEITGEARGGFKNFLQNFGDESQFWWFWWFLWFWYRLQNFGKILSRLLPYSGTNFSKFWLSNLSKSQSYDKPPWRNFNFLSNVWFWWKSKIWNP